ncbi:MAG: NADPH-dependent F420 reductase, partial [Actinomycetota bacterium]|nr:NADPH-dependent F420 reductase [Actinomycetota bacterium]
VPPAGVEPTARELAGILAGKIVVSVASSVVFHEGRPTAEPRARSLAELAADAARDARVVAGFHTVAARALVRPGPIDEDVLTCSDDADAHAVVRELAERLVAGRGIDCGPLEIARSLEGLTPILLNINRNYRRLSGVRITGL